MAARAARAGRASARRGVASGGTGGVRIPSWVWWTAGIAVLVALLGGLGYLTYGALDRLYPQGLWRYFRPVPGAASGSILYRHVDGYLLLAPVGDPGRAQRLSPEAPEIVRDAVFLS